MTVEYRRLGRTNLQVSLLSLGSGGRSRLGQAHGLAQDEVTEIVRRALDLGINFLDTAPAYDRSEELLGQALLGVPRDSYVLCTKSPHFKPGAPPTADELRSSIEASLRRLKTDVIDLLYLHGVPMSLAGEALDRYGAALDKARADGLIRFVGVSENFATDHTHETLRTLLPTGFFDVAMVGYNVLTPAPARSVFPLADAGDIGVVIMCAVRGVLLSDQRIREVVGEWKAEGLLAADAVPDDAPLGWLLGPWADSEPAAAYKFAAAHPAVSTVLTGTGRRAHLEANADAILGAPLPPEIVERAIATFAPVERNASF